MYTVLRNKDIIYIAKNTAWTGTVSGLQTFAQHLARKLAEQNQVIWVNPASRNPVRVYRNRLRRVGPRLLTYTPWIPLRQRGFTLTPINAFIFSFQVRLLMRQLSMCQPMFWAANIACGELVHLLPRAPWVFSPVGDVLSQADDAFAAHVAVLRAVSEPTYSALRSKYPDKAYLIPNGVDYDAWQDIVQAHPDDPADLRHIPHPQAGFVGNITENRIDFPLLAELARRRPDISLVLVGPGELEQVRTRYFAALPNVHLLGAKSYTQLPLYIRGFDVCLIPYTLNTFNQGTNPIKLYEYFALGKPVISTSVPSMLKYQPSLCIADTVQEFEQAFNDVLSSGSTDTLAEQRRAIAQQHTPEATLRQIDQILAEKRIEVEQ
jgi:glycosyltransferase involved in cell wall biosynthesis